MRAIRLVGAALLLLFAAVPDEAQFSPELLKNMERLNAKPPGAWTASDHDEMCRFLVAMAREMVLHDLPEADRRRAAQVPIVVTGREGGPPAWVDRGTIYIDDGAVGDLLALGSLIGHDLWVERGGELPLGPSLFVRPYARPLLPITPTLESHGNLVAELAQIRCPLKDVLCVEPQQAAVLSATAFVVAHELAHHLLGHGETTSRSLEQEKQADARAWAILDRIVPPAADDDRDTLEARDRVAIKAAPLVVLRCCVTTRPARRSGK